ncbi:uncharacterized protein BKA78DRAFT_371041 [Phyllosticta capitalensis]|uniref:uncharacterized protein n=1 Tax=Phyllosticta capitalensis TaxID=121624 RepID=UPI00312F3496
MVRVVMLVLEVRARQPKKNTAGSSRPARRRQFFRPSDRLRRWPESGTSPASSTRTGTTQTDAPRVSDFIPRLALPAEIQSPATRRIGSRCRLSCRLTGRRETCSLCYLAFFSHSSSGLGLSYYPWLYVPITLLPVPRLMVTGPWCFLDAGMEESGDE